MKSRFFTLLAMAVLAGTVQAQSLISTAVNGAPIDWSLSLSSYLGDKAMDGDTAATTGNRWLARVSALPDVFVKWQFTIARHSLTKYRIYHVQSSESARAPKEIDVYGSNDDANWTLLDSQADVTFVANSWVEYALAEASDDFEYYKLVIKDNRGDGTYASIREFQLYGTVEPVTFFRAIEVQAVQNTTATVGAEFGTPNVSSDVRVYYGTTNGFQNVDWWEGRQAVGTWEDVALTNISHQITGLTPNTRYFFTFRATDDTDSTWATEVLNFRTGPNLYQESFDYGATEMAIGSLANWSAADNLKYDPNGLTHSGLGGVQGGTMWLDDTVTRSSTDSTPDFDFGIVEVGATFWYAAIFDYKGGNSSHRVEFRSTLVSGSSNVSGIYMEITAGGTVQIQAAQSGNATAVHNTGVTNVVDGTHLLLLKVTKGSPKNSPANTRLDFWFNPADTSSEGVLGSPDWTKTDGLWGRAGNTFSAVAATPSQGGRIDEIRVATDFESLTGGVQPSPPDGTVLIIR